ncbi:hypothetical protein KDK95_07980 [Actinospica sp. MGRD01-02]|uniref:Uncharacterized protein n=1 Tax=Actinospica acidithermotolerans TaxID=2828514 RepID=A0A941E4R1_9ACTN|nr:hypothetical protein [Actinospica acidithermotolerans]MBR7826235.1 hypothetical protein [Actinospica acidithermotolerans]
MFLVPAAVIALLTLKPAGVFRHMSQIVEGAVLASALLAFSPLVSWAVISVLGVQIIQITIGTGPVIWRGAGRSRVVLVRTLPLGLAVRSLPGLEHYRRDVRRSVATRFFVPAVLTVIPALVFPGYVTVTTLVAAYASIMGFAMTKSSSSGRRVFARILAPARPERDPELFDPAIAMSRHANYAVSFGDLETAQRLISEPGMQGKATSLGVAEAIHEIRGEHEAALAVLARYPERARTFATLEAVRLGLIAAEAGRADAVQAVADTEAALGALASLARTEMYASMMALYRVETGQAQDARAWVNQQLASAVTPLGIADCLCTRARIEAALGRTEHAGRILRRAQSIAPWYARVAAVRGRLGIAQMADSASGSDMSQITTQAGRPADPWTTPQA